MQLDDDGWLQEEPASDKERDRRWWRRCCVMLPAVLVAAALAAAFELRLLHTKQVGPCGPVPVCLQLLHHYRCSWVVRVCSLHVTCRSTLNLVLIFETTGGHLAWDCSDTLQLGLDCI